LKNAEKLAIPISAIGHRHSGVQAAPLVRRASAGSPNQSKQISEPLHDALIRNSRVAEALFHQNPSKKPK
jgi:hypothetical protein